MLTPMTNEQLWQTVLGELELRISKASFTTWFSNTAILSFGDGKVIISVPNLFTKTWLEKKYHKQILCLLQDITQVRVKEVFYQIFSHKQANSLSENSAPARSLNEAPTQSASVENVPERKHPILNPKYIFDTFVVGKTNELAYAAARAVVSKPGEVYNPLFIYGGVGLGKTHLLQAIGNAVLQNGVDPKKILYVSSEKFTNDYIQTVQSGKAKEFKDRYRNVELLLIDDVQFFSGKERTQEEFFHTFNHLHQQNKQIILSSDRPPKEINSLENRLLSRFEWGMIADVSAPDLETRMAILEKKCQEKNFTLEKKLIEFITENITTNIRELEGVLNRIIASSQLQNIIPTKESIEHIIFVTRPRKIKGSVMPKSIVITVSQYFGVQMDDLLGKSREKKLSFPRQIAMYLLREELKHSFPAIGDELGGRDHSTAMHAHSKISKEIEMDEKLRTDIESLREKIYQV